MSRDETETSMRARFNAVKHLGKFGPVDTPARERKAWELFRNQGMFLGIKIAAEKNRAHLRTVPTEGRRVS